MDNFWSYECQSQQSIKENYDCRDRKSNWNGNGRKSSQGIGGKGTEIGGGEKACRGYVSPGLNYYHYCNDSVMFSFLDQ